jgi:hypothetical protein
MFRPERRGLFRLHLSKIRENTRVPYRIFGSVGHLQPELAAEVAAEPDIEAISLPVGQLRPWEEHTDLLNRLYRHASRGDYTHFVTMHIDSFPIRADWTSHILSQLEKGAAFATVAPRCFSACLFWPRAFRETHHFDLLLPQEVKASDEFRQFMAAHPDYDPRESGIGFLFGCWKKGLRWHEMRPTGRHIYGERVFHLVAATWLTGREAMPIRFEGLRNSFVRPLFVAVKRLLPRRIWLVGRQLLADRHLRTRDGSAAEKTREVERLVADPDSFLRACGAGRSRAAARLE